MELDRVSSECLDATESEAVTWAFDWGGAYLDLGLDLDLDRGKNEESSGLRWAFEDFGMKLSAPGNEPTSLLCPPEGSWCM